ncbi:MAG: hypothetical protein ACYC2K_18865, partial [Gemmatimonadales bacterium]
LDRVLPLYELALAQVNKGKMARRDLGISYSWFSDTFIIFSQGDTAEDFAHLEQSGRLLFQKLVLEHIPVRGAISCGDLYSQLRRNVFIGPALIEAHRYGEGQNWIGFAIAPSAQERPENVGLSPSQRAHYREVTDKSVFKATISQPLFAFAFNNGRVMGRNPYVSALEAMRLKASSAYVREKYDRTLRFLQLHSREM